MGVEFISILALGFILGLKHAIEPDHVIAVSTIASQHKNVWKSSMVGVFWGIGHTLTLFITGLLLITLKANIPNSVALSLEFLVGIMLVYLGIANISAIINKRHRLQKSIDHDMIHHTNRKTYTKSMGIGFIHGLAGSAAMILLVMSTNDTLLGGAVYILVFGIGTIVGMLLCTIMIGVPFATTQKNEKANNTLALVIGGISTVFGFYYMYNLGIVEGLFQLWVS